MFGDIKQLVDMLKKSDAHLTSILKEMKETNHHLNKIIDLLKEQNNLQKKDKR